MMTLYEKLKIYSSSDYYGFHMPGHKRNEAFAEAAPSCEIDITEIEGFDDLHHADGVLREAQDRAAALYGAEETHFLINGSTVGILSGILGVTDKGDSILVARNCHKSVYHAIDLNELEPVYLYPEFDRDTQLNMEISVQDVRESLEAYPQIRAVVIVSPTYDGVVSDVAAIAEAVHEKGLPLIVDEAHGAHFGFHPYFPENSNRAGADIVIHSLHKTLPSLTQTALIHINGSLVSRRKVRKYLRMLQSSSPSYVLMASIDSCIHLLEEKMEELFLPYICDLDRTRAALGKMKSLRLIPEDTSGSETSASDRYDCSKIIISTKETGISGRELYYLLLERYHLQMEMKAGTYVVAMTSFADRPEGFERLIHALAETDQRLSACLPQPGSSQPFPGTDAPPVLPRIYSTAAIERIRELAETGRRVQGRQTAPAGKRGEEGHEAAIQTEVQERPGIRKIPQIEAAGYISLEYVYLYPPGIPIIVPGELITEAAVRFLDGYARAGYTLEGPEEENYLECYPAPR